MAQPRAFWYHNACAILLFTAFFLMAHAGIRIIPQSSVGWRAILGFYLPGLLSITFARHGTEEPYRFPILTLALAGLSGTGFAFGGTAAYVLGLVFGALTAIFWLVAVREVDLKRSIHDLLLALLCAVFGAGIALGYRFVPAMTCLWISVAALALFLALVVVAHFSRRRSSNASSEGRS